MATAKENKTVWSETYNWQDRGDEWSAGWGGPEAQWYGTLFRRVHRFIPTGTILEIAPGYGRWTHFLKDLCQHLVIVDLAENCIEGCKERFADASNIEYHVNDGKSLEMIADKSIDFAFSFDSLVHADANSLRSYLQQLSAKLKPNGTGFIHHSNLGAYIKDGVIPPEINSKMWRDPGMSAKLFAEFCDQAGLRCVSQELTDWTANPEHLIDCFSVFTPKDSTRSRANVIVENPRFMEEMRICYAVSRLYP